MSLKRKVEKETLSSISKGRKTDGASGKEAEESSDKINSTGGAGDAEDHELSDGDDDDAEDDDENEDEENDIKLEGDLEADMTQYTFDFKDMKVDYSNDISRLLGELTLKDSSWALSNDIANQGIFIFFFSFVYSVSIHSPLPFILLFM